MKAASAALVIAGFLAASPLLQSHEIGTTRIAAAFLENGNYDIEIVTDATALAEKLQSLRGGTEANAAGDAYSLAGAADPAAWLKRHESIFRKRAGVVFDGNATASLIEFSVSGEGNATSAAAATIHLRGAVPQGARQFEWTYGWTFATYPLVVTAGNAGPETVWLEGGERSKPIALKSTTPRVRRWAIALQYLGLGFTHIVPKGLDHMLFVAGIFLISRRLRQILAQVSAFTIAHSITLALSIYGWVEVPSRLVEPMIAISILYVAVENILVTELKRWRVALVFAFGLLHGLGFAGALKEVGLPRSEFATALITFNLGVEAGQLAVIGALFLAIGWYSANRQWYRRAVVVPASILIACTAAYWTVARLI
jgi:hydrogenase/urease accessory protein HupE